MASQGCTHILFPRGCEYVALDCKGDCFMSDVVILRILERDYPGLAQCAHSNHRDLHKEKREEVDSEM